MLHTTNTAQLSVMLTIKEHHTLVFLRIQRAGVLMPTQGLMYMNTQIFI